MSQAKQNLFNNLKTVFPQPHLMKDPVKRISWSVAVYISKVTDHEEKHEIKSIGNMSIAQSYVDWMKNSEDYVNWMKNNG